MAVWAVVALALILFSYAFTLLLAAACVYVPYLILTSSPGLYSTAAFIAGVVLAAVILWSLVPRRDQFAPPGPRLAPSDHPRLFAEISNIAAALNEPMPVEVYLILNVNAWVSERGGVMGVGSRRVMGLGLPLIRVLPLSQFRAVLAHEFGHYYTGDTRLWPLVHKTRDAMARTLTNLGSESMASAFGKLGITRLVHFVAVTVLVAYWKLFLRTTQAVSRRQEYRADELAAHVAGAQALIDGLRTIHGASGALAPFWQSELIPAFEEGFRPPIAEGFARFLAVPRMAKAISEIVEEELQGGHADPYDTHPPLKHRLAALGRLNPGRPQPDDAPAIGLLEATDTLEVELLRFAYPNRDLSGLKPVSWDRMGSDVCAPAWRRFVSAYASLLDAYTVEQFPDALADASSMAPRMKDPEGALLEREHRVERARQLCWRSLALVLWERGWTLHAGPAEFYFELGPHRIAPSDVAAEILSGAIPRAEWSRLCAETNLSALPLLPAQLSDSGTSTSQTPSKSTK